MGVMRFQVTPPSLITDEVLAQAHLTGIDRVPWRVEASLENGMLLLRREVSDSASLHIPWTVAGHGQLLLSSGSLVESHRVYQLPLELARGKLCQVRNQLSDWQGIGLNVPETVRTRLREGMEHFRRAIMTRDVPATSAELAQEALRLALDAADQLVMNFNEQAIGAYRRRVSPRLPTWLGANLGIAPLDETTGQNYLQTFNAAAVPFSWKEIEIAEGDYHWEVYDRQIEWCREHHLSVCGGPLIQLDHRCVPDWLFLWEGDFEEVVAPMTDFVRAVVARYRGRVHWWQCAARLNTAQALGLSEEDRLRLAAWLVETIRNLDPETPALLSFDRPWAEYLSRADHDFPPIHFADALLRAGVGLTGLMLELNVGYDPGGVLPRDTLELSRMLDYWSLLGAPLYISLCFPSGSTPDPLALGRTQTLPRQWSPQLQQAWISRYAPTILAKRYVQGLLWNQLRDAEPHEFPHGGLFDLRRQPKPALRVLTALRQAHLK